MNSTDFFDGGLSRISRCSAKASTDDSFPPASSLRTFSGELGVLIDVLSILGRRSFPTVDMLVDFSPGPEVPRIRFDDDFKLPSFDAAAFGGRICFASSVFASGVVLIASDTFADIFVV